MNTLIFFSHPDHDPSLTSTLFNPITCMLLSYPALLALYNTNVPCFMNLSASPCSPTFSPLLCSTFPWSHFQFLFNPPLLSPHFLCHYSFLLMTRFSATFFFVFIISESPVHEGRDYSCLYLYISTDADLLYLLYL